jgi:erythromycin esterase-like protein
VVALGEACHGSREFTQLAHRIIAFLVERMGFAAIGIEADPADAAVLNAYILHGAGTPEQAIRELRFWTGPTREVLDLAVWLRAFNENPAHARKVSLFGLDPLVAALTPEHGIEGAKARDRAMAGQVKGALGQLPPGSKVVLWAHDDHVSKALPWDWGQVEPMGLHLDRVLGQDYLAIGTAFRSGGFLALDADRPCRTLAAFAVPAHPEATLGAALASAGMPCHLLDLRALRGQGEAEAWFRTPQVTWVIGADFFSARQRAHLRPIVAPEAFDLMLFVERIRPPQRLD